MKFAWDKRKAKSNYARHGVSFDFAKAAFKDPFAMEFLDDRHDYGEERFVMIGRVSESVFVCGVYRNARRNQNYLGSEGHGA